MLEAKWEAVVKLALIQEPRLGEKLLPLRAIKETRYNITVGSHDKPTRDSAVGVIGAYTEAINKITTAVWGEARGIRVEECPPPGSTPAGTNPGAGTVGADGGQAPSLPRSQSPIATGLPQPPSLGRPLPAPPASSLATAPAVLPTAPVMAAFQEAGPGNLHKGTGHSAPRPEGPVHPTRPVPTQAAPAAAAPASFLDTVAPQSIHQAAAPVLGAGTLKATQEPAPNFPPTPVAAPSPQPSPKGEGAVPPDALLSGLLEEMRKKLRAEIEGEVRQDMEKLEQGLRQKVESEVAASILEMNKKAELQDTMMMVMDGKQLVQEVWQIWANLETLMAQSKDEELMKHIFVAEEKLHALLMLASRLLPVAVVEDRVHKSTHKK